MPNTVIDTLEVKITANAMTAAKALDGLANSLKNVRAVLNNTNKAGASIGDKLAKNIHDLNNAMTRINNDGIKKLQFLSNALNSYANAVQKVKAAGALGSAVRNIQRLTDAISIKSGGKDQGGGSEQADRRTPVIQRIGDAFKDAGKKAKDFFSQISIGNTVIGKLFRMVGRIAIYRAIRTALKAISEAFTEGLKNAYAYSQQSDSFKSLADTLDHIKTITYQMTNQLGALYGEIKQLVAPIVEWLVEKVRQLSERLTELFAALNGKSTYLRAKQVAQTWGEATDNVKAFKQQLLGLDELNNLTTQKNSGKEDVDPKDLYEEVNISSKIKDIAEDYNSLKKKLEGIFNDYRSTLLVGVGLLAIGAIFTFFTTKKILGLGLMLASGLLIGKTVIENKDQMLYDIQRVMQKYRWLFVAGSIGLTAVGAALMFTGHWGLGLGCILAGVSLGVATVSLAWQDLYNDIQGIMKEYKTLITAVQVGMVALGTILLFTGHPGLGLGLILGSGAITIAEVGFDWEGIKTSVHDKLVDFFGPGGLIAFGAGLLAIGALLAFTGTNIPLGIAMIVEGAGGLALGISELDWDAIYNNITGVWDKIVGWWNRTVVATVKRAVKWLEENTGIDWNKDGIIGEGLGGAHTSGNGGAHGGGGHSRGGDTTTTTTTTTSGTTKYPKVVTSYNEYVDEMHKVVAEAWESRKALGGFVGQGSLFYAGEAGPEFVGSMGNSSAVANTSQMTEAIYKAAYMGMSQALKENGGNGLSGFVPASTDDLFIAMRKKASVYNKTTGNSAFA